MNCIEFSQIKKKQPRYITAWSLKFLIKNASIWHWPVDTAAVTSADVAVDASVDTAAVIFVDGAVDADVDTAAVTSVDVVVDASVDTILIFKMFLKSLHPIYYSKK